MFIVGECIWVNIRVFDWDRVKMIQTVCNLYNLVAY